MVYLGTDKSEIDTPALLLNLEIMESNIKKMSKFFQSVTAELRPMIKTRAPVTSPLR
jgi:D-serine deaminase-like pyridoxal phosphate-dependent protein